MMGRSIIGHSPPGCAQAAGKGCACWAAIARQIALGLFSPSPSGSLRRRPNSSPSHAGRDLFDRFTLRMETLRTLNRVRTAATVRLCLSAISVMLFPASTISRSCLSSSGPHGRLGFWAPAIISLPAGGILIAAIE